MKIDPAGFAGLAVDGGAPRIAVVERDEGLRWATGRALRAEGFEVLVFDDGLRALEAFDSEQPALALIDAMVPGIDGFDLLREIRERWPFPVILTTARPDEIDELLALRLGADDVLRKPVAMRLVAERIRARLRRPQPAPQRPAEPANRDWPRVLERGPLRMDAQRHAVSWKEIDVPLTATEFVLLEALAKRPGHVKSRDQLMDVAYHDQVYVDDRTIDSHIKRLRKKLRAIDPEFSAIETLYGIGYRYSERACRAAH